MRYVGRIDKINHIVISDPSYEKDVWCRYEKDNLKEKNWIVNLEINSISQKIEDFDLKGVEFYMLIKRNDDICEMSKEGIEYLNTINLKKYDIGMDTACIALGINNNAEKIVNSYGEWQPSCALKTLTDGMFGEVKEGKDNNNNLQFLYVSGYLSDETNYNEESLKEYLINQFEIKDLLKDKNNLEMEL